MAAPRAPVAASSRAGALPTRAQARAYVRAVNLRVTDIPEASVTHWRRTHSSAQLRAQARRCEARLHGPQPLVEESSPKLKRGHELEVEQFVSGSAVLTNSAAARRTVAVAQSPAVLECTAKVLTHELALNPLRNARWGKVTTSKLQVPVAGASATYGMRIEARVELPASEITVPIYYDEVGFLDGHAGVTLGALSITQPVPENTEQELLALLFARAKSTPL